VADPDAGVRVSAENVKDIIDTSLTTGQINAFINSAHAVVASNLVDKGLSEITLTQIELWLAAHLLSARDQRKKAVKVDDVSVTYQGETGQGLKSTFYGQQVLNLDTTNTLAALGQKKASIQVNR